MMNAVASAPPPFAPAYTPMRGPSSDIAPLAPGYTQQRSGGSQDPMLAKVILASPINKYNN